MATSVDNRDSVGQLTVCLLSGLLHSIISCQVCIHLGHEKPWTNDVCRNVARSESFCQTHRHVRDGSLGCRICPRTWQSTISNYGSHHNPRFSQSQCCCSHAQAATGLSDEAGDRAATLERLTWINKVARPRPDYFTESKLTWLQCGFHFRTTLAGSPCTPAQPEPPKSNELKRCFAPRARSDKR